MTRYEEIDLQRDCDAIAVPQGDAVVLPAETPLVITQVLGDSFTVQAPTLGGLYRIAGKDADALGRADPRANLEKAATLASAGQAITEAIVLDTLREVYDPEIPVNIVDLGLIYDVAITPGADGASDVAVQMTLTAPGCGMGEIIAGDARERVQRLPGIGTVQVDVVWEPPWTAQRISAAARSKLGLD
jgi:probable FeS assembly SUF system protein SufT